MSKESSGSVLAIIPARAGSKGIIGKNTKDLCGKPLITYSFEASINSKEVTQAIVSTNCPLVKSLADEYGLTTVNRPEQLAADNSSITDAIADLLLKNDFTKAFEYILLLQPTSPLRTSSDIDMAIKKLKISDAEAIISVEESDIHLSRLYQLNNQNLLPLDPVNEKLNRQNLQTFYHRNGSIYCIRRRTLLRENSFFPKNNIGFIMKRTKSVSIDTEYDFLIAELLLKNRIKRKENR